jgi:hypothetical protein
MGCCGGDRALSSDRQMKRPPASAPIPDRVMHIVGNFTGVMILSSGRNVGHVYPGAVIRVTKDEAKDPRLIPMSQQTMKAVRAMVS